jgi:hypothetical protein
MNDFAMYAGDSRIVRIAVKDEAGAPVDITGSTLKWLLSRSMTGEALVEKATGDGIELQNPAAGTFGVTLEPADTEDLEDGIYYHEAEMTLDGDISTVVSGPVLIERGAIRP